MRRLVLARGLAVLAVAAGLFLGACSSARSGTPVIDGGSPPDGVVVGDDAGTGGDAAADDGGDTPDAGLPETCEVAGAIESVVCGRCGSVERFCTAEGLWEYGTCADETGACAPGELAVRACGNCGTQPSRCSDTCEWEPTAVCASEGVCASGARTRSSAGCGPGQSREVLCSDACAYEPATACVEDGCTTPGALESVRCGMCGSQERFCSAAGVWEYAACGGEGGCIPGTTGSVSCGMCGARTQRCTDACGWIPFGMCGGEGTCTAGETIRTSDGCAPGATRVMQCDGACGYSIEVAPCTTTRPVDVTLLLDETGSNLGSVATDLPTLTARCISPLLALRDVQVGVSYAGEFPVEPHGGSGDRPFEGGIEPTSSALAIGGEIGTRPMYAGSDLEDSVVEALSVLTGGVVAASSAALTCSAGRVGGGCWRSGAVRVIVVHTDSPIHNGPDPASAALLSPYTTISPAPAEWPAVRARMSSSGTVLLWIDSNSAPPAPAQFDEMLSDLGQPMTDRHFADDPTAVGTACDAIVERVRVLAGL